MEYISPFINVFVGLIAFAVYRFEKQDKEKSAATIILENIRSSERNIDKLKESASKGLPDVHIVNPNSFSDIGWTEQRHLIVKHLDYDEFNQLSLFFERVSVLKEFISEWQRLHYESLISKTTSIQGALTEFAKDSDKNKYQKRRDSLTEIIHPEGYWFDPRFFRENINSQLSLLNPVSTSSIGDKLKLITEQKIWNITGLKK